ncbi:hypothetical protein C0J52_03174 [Blattella germanica]|nr:hypothetical protein C0J52_03174 [Blattella germanica]
MKVNINFLLQRATFVAKTRFSGSLIWRLWSTLEEEKKKKKKLVKVNGDMPCKPMASWNRVGVNHIYLSPSHITACFTSIYTTLY